MIHFYIYFLYYILLDFEKTFNVFINISYFILEMYKKTARGHPHAVVISHFLVI